MSEKLLVTIGSLPYEENIINISLPAYQMFFEGIDIVKDIIDLQVMDIEPGNTRGKSMKCRVFGGIRYP